MKSIARATICILFLFSLATLALAETRGTPASGQVVNDLFRQLIVDSRSAAPSPESWDDIKIDRPAKDYIDVELVPLSPGKKTYLITGKLVPFYGAHAEMYWVYEKTTSGYRQLDELGANYSVHVLQSSHNGYRDLETTYVSGAGTVLDTCRLVFNGKKYEGTCTSKEIATKDGASRRSTNDVPKGQTGSLSTPTISVPPEVFQAFIKTCARPRYESTRIRGLRFQGLDVIGYEQADSGVGSQWGFIVDIGLSDFKAKYPDLAKRVNMTIPRAERTDVSKLYREVTESGWTSPGKTSISCISIPKHPH
jgi:hypothetical protein